MMLLKCAGACSRRKGLDPRPTGGGEKFVLWEGGRGSRADIIRRSGDIYSLRLVHDSKPKNETLVARIKV